MPRLAVRLPVIAAYVAQRQPADDGDAMVHALAVGDDVLIAERLEHGLGKQAAFDLGFLKAQDVGRFLAQEFLDDADTGARSEEHTSELQSLMRISYAVF